MKHDYESRIAKLQDYMKEQKLDAFIVSTQDSIYYLAGASYMPLERPFFIIVRQRGAPDLVVPKLEYEHLRGMEGFNDIKSYFEFPRSRAKTGSTGSTACWEARRGSPSSPTSPSPRLPSSR